MGNLAERYGDAKRSGVYRVSSARVPLLAAREAGADLHECGAADAEAELSRAFGTRSGTNPAPYVLLVRDITSTSHAGQLDAKQLIRTLQGALRREEADAVPRFVVLVDPLKTLDLPGLWREPAITPGLVQT